MTLKTAKPLCVPATVGPGDYPLGSAISRAAARAKLALQRDTRERIEFIVEYYTEEQSRVIFGEWQDWGNALMRLVYISMVLTKAGQPIPRCPDCGKPFSATGRPACREIHDPDRVV